MSHLMQTLVHFHLNSQKFYPHPEIITSQPKTQERLAKKLLDEVRDRLRAMHSSYRTEETYIDWMRRYILFHRKRHPNEMGEPEIQEFLTHLAADRKLAASTHTCPGGAVPGEPGA